MTRKPMPTSGWCESQHHDHCPEIMRVARYTPKGTELRQLICTCACHKETK